MYGNGTRGRLEASMGWTKDGGGLATRRDLDHRGANLLILSLLKPTKRNIPLGKSIDDCYQKKGMYLI